MASPNLPISQLYGDEGNNSKHVLLWSGGCDSNALLYELIDAYGAKNVIALSYKYPWLLEEKAKTETIHRNAFKAKLKLRGEKFSGFTHAEFNITQHQDDTGLLGQKTLNVQSGGKPQSIGWLFMLPHYAPENSYVYAGYLKEDDAICYLEHYEQIFKSVTALLGDRGMTLRIPYKFNTKYQIIEKLFKYGIYEESWYCEMPTKENIRCLDCVPCKTHLAALTYLSVNAGDELTRKLADIEIDKYRSERDKLENSKNTCNLKIDDLKDIKE